jgi:hypothetical protein
MATTFEQLLAELEAELEGEYPEFERNFPRI